MKNRIEFNMHSNFSRMNGVNSTGEIIDRAIELGMDTVAITDIGSVKGLPRAYDYIKLHRKNIKLILGMEAFYAQGRIYCEVKNEDNFSRIIILVKNETGRKNLYKLISAYYKNGYAELKNREGLLIGLYSICSDIIRPLVVHQSDNKILERIKFYDFILVDPQCYHKHNERILSLADKTDTLVIASNSPYHLNKYFEEEVAREALRYADNRDPEYAVDSVLYSTIDMLNAFDYLGKRAEEVVIDNGYKLADMIEDDIPPIPQGYYLPDTDGMFEEVKNRALTKVADLYKINVTHYGYDLPEPVKERLNKELSFLSKYKGHVLPLWIAMKIADDSKEKGYPVISRGAVGSSFIAYLIGLTNVNPLKPHYTCMRRYKDQCNYIEFVDEYESGFDLPAKKCPRCGRDLNRDGHNIPYETMFGFDGGKEPYIDLNLCPEHRMQAIDFSTTLFKDCITIYGCASGRIVEKTAEAIVNNYFKENPHYPEESKEMIVQMCCGAFRKTGLNVAKILYIPEGYETEDFTPVEYVEDYEGNLIPVTHFDCRNSLYYTLFSFNYLAHNSNDMQKRLKEKTGVEPTADDIADNAELLNAIKEGNTESIPEMCTEHVRKMIEHTKPKKFSDCVAINGLAHGANAYEDNANTLFAEGVCDFESVIAFRENILLYLDKKRKEYAEKTGNEAPLSYFDCFRISECTRTGRVEKCLPEYEDALKEIGTPDWYIDSAKKIKYLFPKAHAVEYMITAFKLLWYKLNYPKEFKEADCEVNGIVPTGLKKLDEILEGGFRKGDLCLIGARPAVGKTTFAVQLADYIADGFNKVVFFSLESPKKRLEKSLYKQSMSASLMEIDETSVVDTEYIRNKLIETEADVAVIDYLGLIKPSEKKDSWVEEISDTTYELRSIAEELNVAIIVTMQLSRDYGKQINELKHNCTLEGICFGDQDSHTILFLNRDDYNTDNDIGSNAFQIIVAKNAYGNIGTIDATFDSEKRLFKEVL